LLASGGSHLLAQQRNSDTAAAHERARASAPQQNSLQRLAAGTVFRDCADCPEMVVIPPGNVTIGAPNGEAGQMGGEGPQRSVAIANAIGLGKYEVTKAQFAQFVQASGRTTSGSCFVWGGSRYWQDATKDWRNPGFPQSDNDPVVCVNWGDAKAYTDWLSKKAGRTYRLPTEVEWEYAARAGNRASRPWGDNAIDACAYANVADASAKRDVPGTASWLFHECDDKYASTAPVGSYPPNAFGLYDTLGNAWEWTEECFRDDHPGANGPDATSAECGRRVLRGGAWVDSPAYVSYDFRFFIGSNDRDFYIGFRVAATD